MKRIALAVVSSLLASYATATVASPPVKVRLRSSWSAPNLLLEVIEAAAAEQPDTFFYILDILTDPDNFPQPLATLSNEAIYQASLETLSARGFLSQPGALASFDLALALHTASPKIEAFAQVYRDRDVSAVHFQFNTTDEADCGSWVEWYGMRVCDADLLRRLALVETLDPANEKYPKPPRPKLLPFDHVFPPASQVLETPPWTAIFHANITSPNFRSLHSELLSLASPAPDTPSRIQYVFRYIPEEGAAPNYLSGYGVGLDLKKMDYLALDDRRTRRRESTNDESSAADVEDVDLIHELLLAQTPENAEIDLVTPLTEEEFQELGLKASQLIVNSADPLTTLKALSQNFPRYASQVGRRIALNESLQQEIKENQYKAAGGVNIAWLNGRALTESDMNPFKFLSLLRKERTTVLSLVALGLSPSQAIELLSHSAIGDAQSQRGAVEGMFDASDREEGGDVILWLNDFEKDARYEKWPATINALLRPLYPGQFPSIGRNLYNIVLSLDLSRRYNVGYVTGPIMTIIQRGFPFRFGIAPIVETEEGRKAARLFYYLTDTYGYATSLTFLQQLAQTKGDVVDFAQAKTLFNKIAVNEESIDDKPLLDFDTVVAGRVDGSDFRITRAAAYNTRLDATLASSPQGHTFINGKHYNMNEDFTKHLQMEIQQQTEVLQEAIYSDNLKESGQDMSVYFYDLPTTSKRRNRHIYPGTESNSLRIFNLPELFARVDFEQSARSFIYSSSKVGDALSFWIIGDLDDSAGSSLVKEALQFLETETNARLAFVHTPANVSEGDATRIPVVSSALFHLGWTQELYEMSPKDLLADIEEYTNPVLPTNGDQEPLSVPGHSYKVNVAEYSRAGHTARLLARELGLAPGERALLVNGRLIGPIEPNGFRAADFASLSAYELQKRVSPVAEALKELEVDPEMRDRPTYATLLGHASSIVSAAHLPDPSAEGLYQQPQRPRQRPYEQLGGQYSSFSSGDESKAIFQLGILVDPVSETAQKWSSLIQWIAALDTSYVKVVLNPASHKELALKRFYRDSLQPRLTFDESGAEVPPMVTFRGLPVDPIYTLAMDVPPSWLVRPKESQHDLDNIHLASLTGSEVNQGVEAIFDLDYLVIEGHARESGSHQPPRGLQLQLTTRDSTPVADTLVVANLGYLQFKTKPGVFKLDIRPGRGRDVFEIESVGNEGWNSPPVQEVGSEITVTSFEGLTLYPRFKRRPGMADADVLVIPEKTRVQNVVSGLKSQFNSLFHKPTKKKQAEINIFTVASGLLYERFASIMILSVLRNTKSTVKFWFIENFLSPSFLEFIPHMAEAYNFEYELVTYKWPSWLRAQREKQRVIWGYKILFLDVLFPMDLKKVIFVDADQIVRADLKELVDLDLQGAPYGYTPMGDDNLAMEGFRFWKTGYWKDFLRGKPYHISALYVIDLVRFRELAAGDRLRGHYQGLSADPNSLANLDQDLPNNLQHDVPIFSLDKNWLWCETWCSADRLAEAKTIDLCQNPLTKEPKLARARQIPEWEEYDAEIAQFARRLADEGKVRSDAAAAGADKLASLGVVKADVVVRETGDVVEVEKKAEQGDQKDDPGHDEL